MSITTGTKHEIVVHCFVCDQQVVVDKLKDMGFWPRSDRPFVPPVLPIPDDSSTDDDEPNWPKVTPIRREVCRYSYVDQDGVILWEKIRFDPKGFSQVSADGRPSLDGIRRVLYRFPDIVHRQGEPVWLCEGEKDADNLAALGFLATTHTEGAKESWSETMHAAWKEYAEALRGRDVVLLPDNDSVGVTHMTLVSDALRGIARSVKTVKLSGLGEKGDVSDWIANGGTAEQLRFIADQTPAEGPPYRLITLDELENMPSPQFLAHDWLVKGSLATIYGPSGVGKSFVTLDLILSVASGHEWLQSVHVERGPVVYIAAEGVGGLKERVRAWKRQHPGADLSSVRILTTPINLLEMQTVGKLIDSIREQCPDPSVIVFDTLARSMFGGDENSAKDMGSVIAAADIVKSTFGSLVVLVHHTGKNGDTERGSSALRAACDTSIYLTTDNGTLTLECVKQKDAAAPEKITLKMVQVEGTESIVLEPFDATGQMTQSARRILGVLYECFPLNEGASTSAWLKASKLPDNTFYASRRLLIKNQAVQSERRGAPNLITTLGCRDLGIEPDSATPTVTTDYYRLLPSVVEPDPTTTTTVTTTLGSNGSSSSAGWAGAQE